MKIEGINFETNLKRLEIDTEIKPFESEDEELNDFLLHDAKNYLAQMLAVTYLIENDTETVAYFCLSNDNLKREIKEFLTGDEKRIWNRLNRIIPDSKRRGSYPAIKIGRLAVTKQYARNGFGRIMINTVKKMYLEDNQKAGCRFITVDAYSNAFDFYARNGFDFITDKDKDNQTRAMFLDLKRYTV